MNRFELAQPRSVEEAVAALDREDPTVRPVGGGTALMLMMKQKLFRPTRLVSLHRIAGDLRGIHIDGQGGLRIGAMTALRDLELESVVSEVAPVVVQALHSLANVRVRNVATIGGHLAHADPHMDLPPILLAMGARVQAVSPRGSRWITMEELFQGYYETCLEKDELLTELLIPAQTGRTRGAYEKFCSLSADDWPTLGVAVFFEQESERLTDVRVVVSAATERPIRLGRVEEMLTGERPSENLFKAAAEIAAANVRPLPDIRGSVSYKREMVRVFVRQALEQALKATPHKGV